MVPCALLVCRVCLSTRGFKMENDNAKGHRERNPSLGTKQGCLFVIINTLTGTVLII